MKMSCLDLGLKLMTSAALILAVTKILVSAAQMVAVAKVLAAMPWHDELQYCQMSAKKVVPSAVAPLPCGGPDSARR